MRDMHAHAFNRSAPISYIRRTQKVLKLTFSCNDNFSYPRVSILPQGEEFLVMLYSFGPFTFLPKQPGKSDLISYKATLKVV